MAWPEQALTNRAGLRQWEQSAAAANLGLMQQAGHAIASWLAQHFPDGARLLFAVGPGNNGGDALIAAKLLATQYRVNVWLPEPVQSQEAQQAWQAYLQAGGQSSHLLPDDTPDVLIDGLFGAGLNRPLSDVWQARIATINHLPCPRIALDVPSGLDGWTGCHTGQAIQADVTLSLLCHKPGLFTADGPDYTGKIVFLPLDCPERHHPHADGELITARLGALTRTHNSHKGRFGEVFIIGGSPGMTGAALLAGRAALGLGAGKVHIHSLDDRLQLDPLWPELMIAPCRTPMALPPDSVVVLGPGLGQGEQALHCLQQATHHHGPLILDADALNLLAMQPDLRPTLAARRHATLITPHPAEAARLLACSTAVIQQDRISAVRQLARDYGVIALLKGAGSLIATPDGHYRLNHCGNAALANSGQGDTLCGVIAAFIAQGLPAAEALAQAVWLHGRAAEHYLAHSGGHIGLRASDTVPLMQAELNRQLASLYPKKDPF